MRAKMLCSFKKTPLGGEALMRTGGRVVECTGLENRRGCKLTVGSNPTLSASILFHTHSNYTAKSKG